MWRVIAILAVLWPSRLSGILDGAPLDTLVEVAPLGLIAPVLVWLHPVVPPACRRSVLVAVAILGLKIAAALTLQQQGWCLTFTPAKPMVRDSTGKPHAWDIRADWLADDPVCSAVMSRSYRDTRDLPVWFFNLPPPDDTPHRAGYGVGEIPVRDADRVHRRAGRRHVRPCRPDRRRMRRCSIDGRASMRDEPGRHQVTLTRGTHLVQLDAMLLSKHWPIVPDLERPRDGVDAIPGRHARAAVVMRSSSSADCATGCSSAAARRW